MKKLLLLPLALASCTVTQQDTQPKYVEPVYAPNRTRDEFKDVTNISYVLNFSEPDQIKKRNALGCNQSTLKYIGAFRQFTKSKPVNYMRFNFDWKYPYYSTVYDFFEDKAELIFIFDGKVQKGIQTSQIDEENKTFGSCQMYQSSKPFIRNTIEIYFNVTLLDLEEFKDADIVQYAIYTSEGKFESEVLSKKAREFFYATWHENER